MGNNQECNGTHRRGWGVFRIIGMTIGGILLAVVLGFFFGWFIEHLWNWLMPSLFGLRHITYWQGFGLFVLAKLLFGGFPSHPGKAHNGRHGHFGHGCGGRDGDWHDDVWKIRGSHRDWKVYEQYWKEEGKAAFEKYLDRVQYTKQ